MWNGIVKPFVDCADMNANWADGHYVVGHPLVRKLEEQLSEMLSLPTVCTTKGMTAIQTAIMATIKAGDTIVCSNAVYPGTKIWLEELERMGIISVIWWNPTDHEKLESIFSQAKGNGIPRLIFTETIGNASTMPVADLEHLSSFAQIWDTPLIVDTTFTPLWTLNRPCDHLIVVGSMTKYHTSMDRVTGGYIAAQATVLERITSTRWYEDHTMSHEMTYFFTNNGQIQDMGVRHMTHSRNAVKAAVLLEGHSAVADVWYPQLNAHPNHDLLKQFGYKAGAVLYCRLAGGEEAATKLADALAKQEGWELAVSFGSDMWRIFPFVGDLAQYMPDEGIVRISAGHGDNLKSILAILESILDTLVD